MQLDQPNTEAAVRAVRRWKSDPVAFGREILGIDLWESEPGLPSQASIARAVPKKKRINVRSGHKIGKSKLGAVITLWAYTFHEGARVILTAPTARQVEEVIWREVAMAWRNCAKRGIDLGGRIYARADHGIRGEGDRQVFGISTDDPDRFSGISGPFVFYILDEGSGIDDAIMEAIEGNAAGGAWIITFGNPTRTEGWFFKSFHELAGLWHSFHISSEDTPNARAGKQIIPGLATREWVDEKRLQWSPHETHPLYAVRVRGDFPVQGSTSVISLALLEAAMNRSMHLDREPVFETDRLEVGLDCARYGDDKNALCPRRGNRVDWIETFGGMSTVQVAGTAHKLIQARMTPAERGGHAKKPRVKVDEIGIGAGVCDIMQTFSDIEVIGVNVATTADEEQQYSNLRAQLMFGVADFLTRGTLPNDIELRAELLAHNYSFDLRGRMKIESKDDIKKRLGRSPDKSDALALSVYSPQYIEPKLFKLAGM